MTSLELRNQKMAFRGSLLHQSIASGSKHNLIGGLSYNVLLLMGIFSLFTALTVTSCRYWYIYYQLHRATSDSPVMNKISPANYLGSLLMNKIKTFFPPLWNDSIREEETIHLLSESSKNEKKSSDNIFKIDFDEDHTTGTIISQSRVTFAPILAVNTDEFVDAKQFTLLMSEGIVLKLHTTYGPRTVSLKIVDDDVRWQAVHQNTSKIKRYKLHLSDVICVESGKQEGHLQTQETIISEKDQNKFGTKKSISKYDFNDLCFSLVTRKTSLYLEASSLSERDYLVRGIQFRLSTLRD